MPEDSISIEVVTPTVRPEMLEVVMRCLRRQTFRDFFWTICAPHPLYLEIDRYIGHEINFVYLTEPPKREGEYYGLNKAWNEMFRHADGTLIVSIQDGLWFPPNLLEDFWNHYQANPKAIVGAVGDQYDQIEHGKPEHGVWKDPRKRADFGSFYRVEPSEIEYTCASIPLQAIKDVGGIDEKFDKYAALSEKEMNARMEKAGFECYLDQGIEYRAIRHERLSPEWEERYQAGCHYYADCLKEIREGKRKKLAYLE